MQTDAAHAGAALAFECPAWEHPRALRRLVHRVFEASGLHLHLDLEPRGPEAVPVKLA